jgi:uncharacterized membrane protein
LLLPFAFWRHKKDLFKIFRNPKIPFQIGTLSGIGSFFWFFAFAIAYVAYVKTLGQIEFILGILMSWYYFKEKIYKKKSAVLTKSKKTKQLCELQCKRRVKVR